MRFWMRVDRALDEDYARVSRDDDAIARRVVIHGAYDIAWSRRDAMNGRDALERVTDGGNCVIF